METLVLRAKDKKESRLLKGMFNKMKIEVLQLSKEDQEEFLFGKILKQAIKPGKASPSSIQKVINKWK